MKQRTMQPALRLVLNKDHDESCSETVRTLSELLIAARRGRVKGVSVVALFHDNRYRPTVTGDARRNPTFARGMVRALDDLLADLVRGIL